MKRSRIHAAALASLCLLAGCAQRESDEQPSAGGSASAPEIAPPLPVPESVMDRKAILLAIIQASSNTALGKVDAEAQRKLDGQRFALRLRFGCDGPVSSKDATHRGWSLDEKRKIQSFRIALDFEGKSDWVQGIYPAAFEAVEGFWIDHPWLLAAGCPSPSLNRGTDVTASGAPPAVSKPVPQLLPPPTELAAMPRFGLAQFFSDTDARTHRRDKRAYEATKSLGEGATPSASGYDLVVSGRLRSLPDGRVIACTAKDSAEPPDCLVSAQFDSVAIELPDAGGTVAKWSEA